MKKFIICFPLFIIILFITYYIFNFSIETSTLPVTNHTIILDAGHGFPDSGAISIDKNTLESNLNLIIVKKIQEYLESSGCNVILTRSDKNSIYTIDENSSINKKKISDMKNRVDISNNSNAELFVSIHMNKLNDSKYSGYQTFYKKKDNLSKKAAKSIQDNLKLYIADDNKRNIKSISNIYLTENIDIPLVIIECGFLSNIEETKLLNLDSYQSKLSWAIYIGIMDYFN